MTVLGTPILVAKELEAIEYLFEVAQVSSCVDHLHGQLSLREKVLFEEDGWHILIHCRNRCHPPALLLTNRSLNLCFIVQFQQILPATKYAALCLLADRFFECIKRDGSRQVARRA